MRLVYLESILWQTSSRTRKCTIYTLSYSLLVETCRYSSSMDVSWCRCCGNITHIYRQSNDNMYSIDMAQNCRCSDDEYFYYNEYCKYDHQWTYCGRQLAICPNSYLYKLSYYINGNEQKSFRFNDIDNELKNMNMYGTHAVSYHPILDTKLRFVKI